MLPTTETTIKRGPNSLELVGSVHVDHPRFTRIFEAVHAVIRLGGCGVAPPCLQVTGPSHIGKSRIFDRLKEEFPVVKDGCSPKGLWMNQSLIAVADHVPVLFIDANDKPTEKTLCMDCLKGLGDPFWDRKATDLYLLTQRLDLYLQACETKAIIVDESQRFVDRGGNVIGDNLLEWLKSRRDRAKVAIILFGLGRLDYLFGKDEQMDLRFGSEKRFEPYRWRNGKGQPNEQHQAIWIGIVRAFVAELGIGLEFDITDELNAYRFYYAALGRVGRLAKHFEATLRGKGDAVKMQGWNLAHFSEGYKKAFRLKPGAINPFGNGFSLNTSDPPEDLTEFQTTNPNKARLQEYEVQARLRKKG